VGELEETYGSSVNARMASHAGDGPAEPVDDVSRAAERGEPPVKGAQWDEVHQRWEVWDDATEQWVVVGGAGDAVDPGEENPYSAPLARDLDRGDELISQDEVVPDITRDAPAGPAPRGAQWNEVAGRWERWDEASSSWVEAVAD
jgi:hypothetical protein